MNNVIKKVGITEKRHLFDIGKRRKTLNDLITSDNIDDANNDNQGSLKKRGFTINLKHSLCKIFKLHKVELAKEKEEDCEEDISKQPDYVPFSMRCLPPIPLTSTTNNIKGTTDIAGTNNSENKETSCDENLQIGIAAYNGNSEFSGIEVGSADTNVSSTTITISDSNISIINSNDNNNNNSCIETLEYSVNDEEKNLCSNDFTTNFNKVKDCGWYWGPISSDYAEKLLMDEPNGSFIVRDSSDDRYIFSLTIKLSGCVRHVRIEHARGFSFGSYAHFKSQTIVDFIENAMEHSRSGRYLFFLHRRPIHGPMRVQLLYPVSRFKHVQSLQHMCRFVILRNVRRDLISSLPLPQRLLNYLNEPQYFLEQ